MADTHPAVPWNAGWTGENRYEVRPCRWADGKLAMWQPHIPGQGKPIFAEPHLVRQRRSIAEMRCTVCGEKTTWQNRYWFGLINTPVEGQFWATTEAPVHLECAKHASQVCPHLRKSGRKPRPMPPAHDVLASLVGGDAVARDFGITLNRPVIGHLKLSWRYCPLPDDWVNQTVQAHGEGRA